MESKILKDIHRGYSRGRVRLFRNNVGVALQGQDVSWTGSAAFIKKAKYIRFGLCVGSSDLVGWKTIRITPDMVGKDFARFVAIEVKDARGRLNKEQKQWLSIADSMGAIVGVARSLSDAREILGAWDENYKIPPAKRFTDITSDRPVKQAVGDRREGESSKDLHQDE